MDATRLDTNSNPRQWWVLQWLDLLEKYRFKKRLERGRNYAKEGNVLSIEFVGTQVEARVQGTAEEPYEITIGLEVFSAEDWDHAIATLSTRALYAAQLLVGQMPDDIEAVFTDSGLNLFPFNLSEVQSRCSCPDPQNPCKHVAAVYYLLGDRFSEDPFVLFQLRGRTREQVLAQIRQRRARTSQGQGADAAPAARDRPDSAPVPAALQPPTASDAAAQLQARFWHYSEPLEAALAAEASDRETQGAETELFELLGDLPLADAPALRQYFARAYASIRTSGLTASDP